MNWSTISLMSCQWSKNHRNLMTVRIEWLINSNCAYWYLAYCQKIYTKIIKALGTRCQLHTRTFYNNIGTSRLAVSCLCVIGDAATCPVDHRSAAVSLQDCVTARHDARHGARHDAQRAEPHRTASGPRSAARHVQTQARHPAEDPTDATDSTSWTAAPHRRPAVSAATAAAAAAARAAAVDFRASWPRWQRMQNVADGESLEQCTEGSRQCRHRLCATNERQPASHWVSLPSCFIGRIIIM